MVNPTKQSLLVNLLPTKNAGFHVAVFSMQAEVILIVWLLISFSLVNYPFILCHDDGPDISSLELSAPFLLMRFFTANRKFKKHKILFLLSLRLLPSNQVVSDLIQVLLKLSSLSLLRLLISFL